MKILNFGSCNIDYVYSIDHIVKAGETETTFDMQIFPGGKGLNQSIAAAGAGACVYHAGCIGYGGDILQEILSNSNVDISYLKKIEEKSGHAIIQVSADGENSIFLFPGSNKMVTKEYIDLVLENFDGEDLVLLQNEISNVDYIVEKAFEKGMCIIFNPSPLNEKLAAIDFAKLSYIILNEIEIMGISGCDTPREGLAYVKRKYPHLKVVLTLGSKGCIYQDILNELYQPAYKAETVDTTAAGDTFTGYFVAELSLGNGCGDSLKIASAAAAVAVSRKGAAPSIPKRKEVLEVLPKMTENRQGGKQEQIKTIIDEYIDNNLKSANIDELAKKIGYSNVYTASIVKRIKGKSFSKEIQARRCAAAADMLLHTDLSIAEIINRVGYENESFFRMVFKEKYGNTPLEFRKKEGR